MDDHKMMMLNLLLTTMALAAAVLAAWLAFRSSSANPEGLSGLEEEARTLRAMVEGLDRTIRQESSSARVEAAGSAKDLRQEVQSTLGDMLTQVRSTLDQLGTMQQAGFEGFSTRLESSVRLSDDSAKGLRADLVAQSKALGEATSGGLGQFSTRMAESVAQLKGDVAHSMSAAAEAQSNAVQALKSDQRAATTEFREAVQNALVGMTAEQTRRFEEFSNRIAELTQQQERAAQDLRSMVMGQLGAIQRDNESKLDQIRVTVDEKLDSTLNQRLNESFKQVSERLELVHKGLGEMQSLASGVGDLKKVLSNVKTRGTWGEVQLGSLLEQMLTREQYEQNVATNPGGGERVEYAVRLPGRGGEFDAPVWLPIDSKCPMEDYQRLVDAAERGDAEAVRASTKSLDARIRACGRDISEKYVSPPHTTDFAIMFVPTEGLYAEVLRCPGLTDYLQRECRVMVAGPTTLAALMNSLQMGFRTLAIEKRSSEVWSVLSEVKTEFGKFGLVFKKVRKKLGEATDTIDEAARRTRAVERKLKYVDQVPVPGTPGMLGVVEPAVEVERGVEEGYEL